jgi:hypothetical protein
VLGRSCTLFPAFRAIVVTSRLGPSKVKKSSNRARRQRDDRAFAEFDAMMRRLARTQRQTVDGQLGSERYRADEKDQTGSNATQE